MTVLYVDLEHARVREDGALGPAHRARFEAARTLLAEAAGEPCAAAIADEVSMALLDELAPTAVVLSGCTTDWAAYDLAAWAGLLGVIRSAPVPILGICAGHQLIGRAHGAAWGPLGPLKPGEADPDPRFAPGRRKQRGFGEVSLDQECPLFAGLGETVEVFQSHYWQLEEVPAGFVRRASSDWSPIQAIERVDRRVFGVQFHPERGDEAHPEGGAVLRGFFGLAGIGGG